MIKFNCQTKDTIKLCELSPFQGNLKHRTDEQIGLLLSSLVEEGMMMPFAVWQSKGKNYILDGHGRLQALIALAGEDVSIFTDVKFPCIYIKADDEATARKSLLQITSSYGNVTKKGVTEFCKDIPTYKAPALNVVMKAPPLVQKQQKSTDAIIRIKVPVDFVEQVRTILSDVDYITVL